MLERLGERPVLGGAAAAAGLSVTVAAVTLPFGIWAHERSVDVGLSTQSIGGFLSDWGKGTAIGAVLAGLVGTFVLWLMRRFGSRWWIPGSAAVLAGAAILTWLAPVVIAPLFNKFDELPPGQARSDVLELAKKAGVDVGHVYEVDASKRTTAINAYVNGLGSSKQVVLYDTLIHDLNQGERRAVVAHELGHVHGNDIQRGLLFVAIVTPLSLVFISLMASGIARRRGAEPGTPAYLPALALAIVVTSFVIGIAGNQLSRSVESRADTFSLQLTNDPTGHDRAPAAARRPEPLRSRPAGDLQLPVRHPSVRGRPNRSRGRLGAGRPALKVTIVVVGKVKAPFAEADAHYRKMLQRHQPVDVIEVRDEVNIEGRIPTRAHVIALDRGGRALTSGAWASWLSERRIDAQDICFLIGGPEGLSARTMALVDERLSLGPQTMAHQLARVVLLEQLFRATKILAREPYHL